MKSEPIDVPRCLKALTRLSIKGSPVGLGGAIADAISAIQANGTTALRSSYIGIKNYAGFGDQRADCDYGYSPSHGYIVFSIGRRDSGTDPAPLGPDEVYLLECVRDFGVIEDGDDGHGRKTLINLTEALTRWQRATEHADRLRAAIAGVRVQSHEAAPA
jgi:hypothetical protein